MPSRLHLATDKILRMSSCSAEACVWATDQQSIHLCNRKKRRADGT